MTASRESEGGDATVEQLQRKLRQKEAVIDQQAKRLQSEQKVAKDARRELVDAKAEIAEQDHEVDQIAQIQEDLLPRTPDPVGPYRFASSYVAPAKAGGDYYDFFPVERDGAVESLSIVIADASGHGPAAAVIMAMMHSLLHAFVDDQTDPDQILSHMNAELTSKELSSTMVTALVVELSASNRSMRYACAGHHPPIIRRSSGQVQELSSDASGVPLAVDADAEYGIHQAELQSGESVLLYTDGAIEVLNPDGEEFGLKRLMQTVADGPGDAEDLIARVKQSIQQHRGGEELMDDTTLLAIEIS